MAGIYANHRSATAEAEDGRGFVSVAAETLHAVGFWLAGAVALVSPWLFASWETWWFWTVTTVLCAAMACSGLATLLDEAILRPGRLLAPHHRHVPTRAVSFLALCAPFLAYAMARSLYPSGRGSPLVAMDCERSLLLMWTPLAIAFVHLLSSRTAWRARLVRLLAVDFVLVCACGVVNHYATNDESILWVASNNSYYVGRASAPYYCPNHFADFAFSGALVFLATAITPRIKFRTLLPVLLAMAFCVFAGFLSLSRGGMASFALTLALGVPLFGFAARSTRFRVVFGVLSAAVAVALATAVVATDNPLVERYKKNSVYRAWSESATTAEFREKLSNAFWFGFDRGQYIGSALRAWKSNPLWGIGPGQHTNRWAEFEASEDGVRPQNPGDPVVFPRQRDYGKHLYEVHSDWTQLLEEYGLVGALLFLVPAVWLAVELCRRVKPCADGPARTIDRALPLGALLVHFMLFVHCFFDFSLQIPATLWLFATLVSLSLLSEGDAA